MYEWQPTSPPVPLGTLVTLKPDGAVDPAAATVRVGDTVTFRGAYRVLASRELQWIWGDTAKAVLPGTAMISMEGQQARPTKVTITILP